MAYLREPYFALEFLGVATKFLDGTRTTIQLVYFDDWGDKVVLAYVHSPDTIEEAKANKDDYIDLMLKLIKFSIRIEE